MNTFKQKSLYAALAGLGALGATGAAQAVNVNPDGLGQVLIYPYYTTRADPAGNTYNSLLSVVNSTSSAKAVKVRFLEGKNSREVLDFNLFLSAYDVWTAAILPSITGGGARVATIDRSCTLPNITALGVDFVNFAYTNDGGGSTLDRTREGYVEIIEMGAIQDNSITYNNVTHSPPGGTPPGCAKITDTQAAADTRSLTGGLFGGMTLINVNSGTDYTEDAVALDNFRTLPGNLYFNAGSQFPDLTFVAPPVSVVFGVNGGAVQSTWANPIDAVSAVLMHDNVLNEFVLDAVTRSGSDWVVTMPTKRYYIASGTGNNTTRLFQRNFNTTVGSCDDVSLNIWDREEQTTSTPVNFSPPPPTQTASLCWEANVITFANSNVLGSTNLANISTNFANGWLKLGFPVISSGVGTVTPVHTLSTATSTTIPLTGAAVTGAATYVGLPVVGFAVQSFTNGLLAIANPGPGGPTVSLSSYGGNFVHKYTRLIQ